MQKNSHTPYGIVVTTCVLTQRTTAHHNGKLIYDKKLCGSADIETAPQDNLKDFLKHATTKDLRKPINF